MPPEKSDIPVERGAFLIDDGRVTPAVSSVGADSATRDAAVAAATPMSDEQKEYIRGEHPNAAQFIVVIRTVCEEQGFSFDEVFPPAKKALLHKIFQDAEFLDDQHATFAFLLQQNKLTLVPDRSKPNSGLFAKMHEFSIKEGSRGSINIAHIPEGHKTRRHRHLGLEITSVIFGGLNYKGYNGTPDDGKSFVLKKGDPPRISPPESVDDFQEGPCAVIYMEFDRHGPA